MNKINTLSTLLNILDSSTRDEYTQIGAQLEIPTSEFQKYTHFSKEHYTRNCIKRTEHYELILLCWEEGQETPIHCHGGEECWVYIVDGIIEEKHYHHESGVLIQDDITLAKLGDKTFMDDSMGYHKLRNITGRKALTLHLYMDPIDTCTAFNNTTQSFNAVDLSYYSMHGKILSHVY